MNKNLKIFFSILAIMFGVFMFIYGGYDNSPGGQLLGLILVIVGIFGLIMNQKKENRKYYIMPVVGFIMLCVNAVGYIFDLGIKHPALTILGLVFVAVGMKTINKKI